MKKRYRILTNIFWIVLFLSSVNYVFQVIPNFQEILEADEIFWSRSNTPEKIQRIGYYFGYLFPISILIFWLLKEFYNPERILSRKGYKSEIANLKKLVKANSISRKEFEEKIDLIISKDEDIRNSEVESLAKQKINKNIDSELASLLELKNTGVLDETEYENKKTILELERKGNKFDLSTLKKLTRKYDFEQHDLKELESDEFIPAISDRDNDELLNILKKSEGYKISAVYQALKELEKRNTTANKA